MKTLDPSTAGIDHGAVHGDINATPYGIRADNVVLDQLRQQWFYSACLDPPDTRRVYDPVEWNGLGVAPSTGLDIHDDLFLVLPKRDDLRCVNREPAALQQFMQPSRDFWRSTTAVHGPYPLEVAEEASSVPVTQPLP